MSTLKYKHLMKVEGGKIDPKTGKEINNNKFYQMEENPGGSTFTATYGRVGCAKPATEIYSMSKWDDKLKEKLSSRKGYNDITDMVTVAQKADKNTTAQEIHNNPKVVELIKKLQEAANLVVAQQYLVKSDNVTQIQIDKAQEIVNNLSNSFTNYHGKVNWSVEMFNEQLKKLYVTIPRKMKTVAENLIDQSTSKQKIADKIQEEQSYLDAMAGQVVTNVATSTTTKAQKTLLDAMGLEMDIAEQSEFDAMKKMLEGHGHRLETVFKVKNRKSQEAFDKNYNAAPATKKKTQLFFHGSRSQNWIFILEQGLKIRPSGAVHTGSMFGDGVYFADDADKSLGYTDNGRWVNGKAHGSVYMGVYKVRVGNQKILGGNDFGTSNLHKTIDKNTYCSVYAKKGNQGLRKSEFVIYNHDQSTIQYLLKIKS